MNSPPAQYGGCKTILSAFRTRDIPYGNPARNTTYVTIWCAFRTRDLPYGNPARNTTYVNDVEGANDENRAHSSGSLGQWFRNGGSWICVPGVNRAVDNTGGDRPQWYDLRGCPNGKLYSGEASFSDGFLRSATAITFHFTRVLCIRSPNRARN